ncbi:NADH:ubiquinone oxidoreductase subunit A [Nautilia sp. PV-1]|jgi:NADH-quinone oxidoreductase subunit A|uniref:NADH-quinone oxidoreductase subunit A n=1 Tax=Nautilia sp. PV-1 TaxID=2579250 RepID=UPI000FD81824|nr:NADH-quinone oxidoreductase subunit A [Nautilia sp. PV-1]AZV47113.1 NADH:ubiquinone oxidoreductase subunit A [Nautilia sp. PV-1]
MGTILFFAAGILLGVILLYLIGIAVAPLNPSEIKNDHFECGLPPSSEVPMKANFGYFIFAIAFIVFDMAGLFFSLFVFADSTDALNWAMVFGILLFAAITISMKEYRNAKSS